jgi:hypothetical protein
MVNAPAPAKEDCDPVDAYFRACHARVDPFVAQHFRYPGAWETNRRALGLDLLRAPVNLAWAPFYVAAQLIARLLSRSGVDGPASALGATPAGLITSVQQGIERNIEADLLMLHTAAGSGAEAETAIDSEAALPDALTEDLARETLQHYASTRTAAADIANSVTSTVVGAFALKQFTPGGIAVGLVLAGVIARSRAAQEFWLGETLGELWYTFMPVSPGAGETAFAIGITLAVFSTLASMSGLVLDPLQARLGLHQRRLHRMLDAIEIDVREEAPGRYRPADPLLARILDAVDALRSTLT